MSSKKSKSKLELPPPLEHHTWEYVPLGAAGVNWDVAIELVEPGPELTEQQALDANSAAMRAYRTDPPAADTLPLTNGSSTLAFTLRTLSAPDLARVRHVARPGHAGWLITYSQAVARLSIRSIRRVPSGEYYDLPRVPWLGAQALAEDVLDRLGVDPDAVIDLGMAVLERSQLSETEEGR